ncbi:hypothetical protein [Hyphomonas sp.]|uniref:dCTP deaminase domain-containing protein n=1 Tax=Hyphomonas sp. TaxID=87 RepID=UPI0025C52F57|nr:hypothetical protein [Hyphomonas sp.]
MFWAGEKILTYLRDQKENIVSGFDPDRIDCNSYRLRVGQEYFITDDHKDKAWSKKGAQIFLGDEKTGAQEGCKIPSGQFAFIMTEEIIRMPTNVMGFISLRTKNAKFKGLVNVSGFHVDPGYNGKLIFSVFNAGPSPIHVKRFDQLFQLWFADIDVSEKRHLTSGTKFVRPPKVENEHIPSDLISNVSDPLVSLQDVSKKIDALDRKIFQLYAIGGAILTLLTLVNILVLNAERLTRMISQT